MKMNIHGKNKFEVKPGLRDYIEEKIEAFVKLFNNTDGLSVNVVCKEYGDDKVVEITIPTKHLILRAEASTEDMFNILAVLQEYEKVYPTRWNRSLEGLQIEWVAHNISFQYGILPVRSGSVDLDNLDGFLYEDAGIKLIFGK